MKIQENEELDKISIEQTNAGLNVSGAEGSTLIITIQCSKTIESLSNSNNEIPQQLIPTYSIYLFFVGPSHFCWVSQRFMMRRRRRRVQAFECV